MTSRRRYSVLRSDPEDLSFFNEMQAALELLGERHRLWAEYRGYEFSDLGLGRHSYLVDSAEISVVEDFQLNVRYIIVDAPVEHAIWLTGFPDSYLPVVPLAELQEAAAKAMGPDPESLVRMALATGPSEDERSVALISAGLRSEDELVRFRAAEAAALTGWAVFAGRLHELAGQDASVEVREMAAKALESCEPAARHTDSPLDEGRR